MDYVVWHCWFLLGMVFSGGTLSSAQLLGCFQENIDKPSFYFTGFTLDCDLNTTTLFCCASACRNEGFQYTGLSQGMLCACTNDVSSMTASTTCNTVCAGDGSSPCGGGDDVFSVFDYGPGGGFISGLSLSMANKNPTTDDTLQFTFATRSGSKLEYSMDFGDGCPVSLPGSANNYNYRYLIANSYTASVSGRSNGTQLVETNTSSFEVEQTLSDLNTLDCPPAAPFGTPTLFNLSIFSGTDVNVAVDAGDGSGSNQVIILDTVSLALGSESVPQVASEDVLQDPGPTGLILPYNGVVTDHSFITHFEMYAAQPSTTVTINIFRPDCPSPAAPFCRVSKQCAATCGCSAGDPYVLYTGTCQSQASAPPPKYKLLSPVVAQAASAGYTLVTQSPPIELFAGDVIGFTVSPGLLAYRAASDADFSDESATDISATRTKTGRRYLLRAVITVPTDLQLEYNYAQPGIQKFTVNLANAVSSAPKTNSCSVSVQANVTGLTLLANPLVIEVNKPVNLEATLKAGSDFDLNWDFGDGKNKSSHYLANTAGVPYPEAYTYANQGVYTVTVNASNAFSWEMQTVQVTVQRPVTSNWDLVFVSPAPLPPGLLSTDIKFTGDPNSVPTNASASFDWGDGNENVTIPPDTTSVAVQHTYTTSGEYTITVVVSNLVGSHTITKTVKFVGKVSGVTMKVSSGNVDTTTPVVFEVNLESGTDFTLTWDFGDGTVLTTNPSSGARRRRSLLNQGPPYTNQHTYANSGVYSPKVTAANSFGSEVASAGVTVQNPVTPNWDLVFDSPIRLPPGVLPTTLQFTGDMSTVPTNVSALIDWGDGKQNVSLPPGATSLAVEHTYTDSGKGSITVTVANLISNYTFARPVHVITEISNLNAVAYTVDPKTNANKTGSGKEGITFNPYTDIFLGVTHKGELDGYLVEFENGTLIGNFTPPTKIKLNFQQDGKYYLKLFGYNRAHPKSEPATVVLDISGVLKNVFISDYGIIRDYKQNKTFKVEFDAYPEGICLSINFNDSSQMETYGDKTWCQKNMSSGSYQGKLTNPINVTHVYKTRAIYIAQVAACIPTSCNSNSMEFTITLLPCNPAPSAFIIKARTNPMEPIDIMRSKAISLKTKTMLKCTEEVKLKRWWTLARIDPTDFSTKEVITIEGEINSWNKSALTIPIRFLTYGLYKVQYLVAVSAIPPPPPKKKSKTKPPKPPIPYQFSAAAHYVRIVVTPLVPMLIAGAMAEVIRGYGEEQMVFMDAAILSLDPDFPDASDFHISWFCNRIDSIVANDELTGPEPDFDKTNIVNIPPPTANFTHKDRGGCFGTGPGYVNVSANNWHLNTGSLYQKNTTYNITGVVRKTGRTVVAWMLLKIVNGMPPNIGVQCLKEELCLPTARGIMINPKIRLALKGSCSGGCPGRPKYNWKVKEIIFKNGLKKLPVPGIENYFLTDDDHGSEYAVNETFFVDFPLIKMFAFELILTGGEEDGQAGLFIFINMPPSGGKCGMSVSPDDKYVAPDGRAGNFSLFTLFRISCWDWEDPDAHQISKYAYYVMQSIQDTENATVEWKYSLAFDEQSEVDVILPCGELRVYVDVIDEKGSFTEVFIEDITPANPTPAEMKAFQHSNWMKSTLQAGEMVLFSQIIQALTTLEDNCLKPNYENLTEDEISHMEEERLLEKADEAAEMLGGLIVESEVSGMDSMTLISSTVSTLLGTGDETDTRGRDLAVTMLDKFDKALNSSEVSAPEVMYDFTRNVLQVVGAVVEGDTQTVKGGHVSPAEMMHEKDIEYDTEVDENFVMPKTKADMIKAAVKENQEVKNAEHNDHIGHMIDTINNQIFSSMAINEKTLIVDTKTSSAAFAVLGGNESMENNVDLGGASFSLPNPCILMNLTGDECNETVVMSVSSVSTIGIMNSYGGNLDMVAKDSATVQLEVFAESAGNGEHVKQDVAGLSEPVDVFIPRHPQPEEHGHGKKHHHHDNSSDDQVVVPRMKWFEHMVYHHVPITKANSALTVHIKPEDENANYLLFLRFLKKPALYLYDSIINLRKDFTSDENGKYKVFLDNNRIGNKTGDFYLGVAQLAENVSYELFNVTNNVTQSQVNRNFTSNYTFYMFSSGCYYYDEYYQAWKGDGCVVHDATPLLTHCKCTHLTSFAGGFFVMPNTIDFAYVFANASFADNLTIYVTIIVTAVIYLMFLLWARRKDKRDSEKIGALPLPDNKPKDKYLYEILVFTGHARMASTESKVSFVLSGDRDETDTRTFGCHERKIFKRDAVDVFVMAVPRPLGQLQYLRVWHDNSGKGNFASWFLDFVMIRDVQTGEKFDFISHHWFAVEEDDGLTDRVIPVAGKEELTEFNHLFTTTSRKNLSDNHIWFSVFTRPPRSRFTRCQRVSSCMALLYLSMLANAMWYGTMPEQPTANAFKFGPLSLSIEQLSVGFMSNILIFPPSFLIIFFFRKARPRKLRPSRINEALKKQREVTTNEAGGSANKGSKLYQRPKRFTLPWWFSIIAWLLCIVAMGASVFFLWAYGITFGNDKTKKWLTSLILSFFMSILITQPIKIFFLALLFSSLCKKVDSDEDDADEDEEDPILHHDERWMNASLDPTKPRKAGYDMSNQSRGLDEARVNRMKEVKMWQILRELFGYLIFIWIISVVGYSSRDPNAFMLRKTLLANFVKKHVPGVGNFYKITTEGDFWNWSNNILIKNLRAARTYNGMPPFGLKGFMRDEVSRMLGYAIIRQIRIKPGECDMPIQMRNVTSRCSGEGTNLIYEDKNNYDVGWKVLTKKAKEDQANQKFDALEEQTTFGPYRHVSWKELNGNPTVTKMGVYSGGGYVIELKGTIDTLKTRFARLHKDHWIDRYTRAIFIECSIFNAQTNMFGTIKLFFEFVPGGGILPDHSINALKNISYNEGVGTFLLVCQVLFVFAIIYFLISEMRELCREGCRRYFASFWNWLELMIIVMSMGAIALLVARHLIVQKAIKVFKETQGGKYVNLQYPQMIDAWFSYCIAIVVFFAMMKFIKMLRFNNRMSALSKTIVLCAKDLGGFLVFFIVCFMAFGQLFFLFFSPYLMNFHSYLGTVESMFSIMLNKFHFRHYQRSQPFWGPVIFFCFALWSSIILINMFLAIIILSFEQIKADIMKKPNEYDIVDFLVGKIKTGLGFGGGKGKNKKVLQADANKEEEMTHNPTSELPQKVDLLLEHINVLYFDGRLDLKSKEFLKGGKHGKRGRRTPFFNRKQDGGDPIIYQSN